ncbi:aurora kinase A- and ninein-interacting protein [Paroedura picta]|uniref:aurora kinase A- and ninein-interacting protein n=1 Tax=Paroedura picta TaxID=143630 RepID=UPI0040564EB0
MKRKGRSPTEEPREACGIWLDTSTLKRHKVQTLIAKPTLSIRQGPLIYAAPEKVPLPFTKQTTISSFFSSQPAGEKKASTNMGLSGAASKSDHNLQGHKSVEGERSQFVASASSLLRESKRVRPHARRASAESTSGWTDRAKGGKCNTAGDNLDFTQQPGSNECTAVSRSPLRDRNGGWRTPSPHLKALRRHGSGSSHSKSRFSDSSDSENADPQVERSGTAMNPKGRNQNRIGLPSGTVVAPCVSAKGPENSQLGCPSFLFSQDSEGHRVISHCSSGERGNLCLLKQSLWDNGNRGTCPAYRDCSEACFPAEGGPQLPSGAEIRPISCYDLLFTEDSEGNRVIKH